MNFVILKNKFVFIYLACIMEEEEEKVVDDGEDEQENEQKV